MFGNRRSRRSFWFEGLMHRTAPTSYCGWGINILGRDHYVGSISLRRHTELVVPRANLLGQVCVWSMERINLLVKSLCGRQKGCIYPGKVANMHARLNKIVVLLLALLLASFNQSKDERKNYSG
jgi:hypothetical protein